MTIGCQPAMPAPILSTSYNFQESNGLILCRPERPIPIISCLIRIIFGLIRIVFFLDPDHP